jgi:ABC-type sugar transport system permease subunit
VTMTGTTRRPVRRAAASRRRGPVRRRPRRDQWAAWAFLAPVTAYLVAFYAYPLYRNLDLSLRDFTVASFVHGDAPFIGMKNYRTVLHDPTFGPALVHTIVFTGIPEELLQAARTDGAGQLRTFWSIVLPLSRNAVVTVSLFAFLWAWSDFVFASTLDGGGARQPITLGIYHYIGNNNQQWNAIMATAVVASLPATLILVLAQRYVAAGVTAGAVKD